MNFVLKEKLKQLREREGREKEYFVERRITRLIDLFLNKACASDVSTHSERRRPVYSAHREMDLLWKMQFPYLAVSTQLP